MAIWNHNDGKQHGKKNWDNDGKQHGKKDWDDDGKQHGKKDWDDGGKQHGKKDWDDGGKQHGKNDWEDGCKPEKCEPVKCEPVEPPIFCKPQLPNGVAGADDASDLHGALASMAPSAAVDFAIDQLGSSPAFDMAQFDGADTFQHDALA